MATISIDIGNSSTRITNAFAIAYNYQPVIDGEANPQTKAQFTKQKVAEYVKEVVKEYESSQASWAARSQALADVESQVIIT